MQRVILYIPLWFHENERLFTWVSKTGFQVGLQVCMLFIYKRNGIREMLTDNFNHLYATSRIVLLRPRYRRCKLTKYKKNQHCIDALKKGQPFIFQLFFSKSLKVVTDRKYEEIFRFRHGQSDNRSVCRKGKMSTDN